MSNPYTIYRPLDWSENTVGETTQGPEDDPHSFFTEEFVWSVFEREKKTRDNYVMYITVAHECVRDLQN